MMLGDRPRVLVVARDLYPPFRVDVTVLFSGHLAKNFRIDWLMRTRTADSGTINASEAETFRVARGPLAAVCHHLAALMRLWRREYDLAQCRDAIILSSVYALVARIRGVPFVYWMSFPIAEGYLVNGRQLFLDGRMLSSLPRFVIGLAGRLLLRFVALPMAAHVFAQSDLMVERLVAEGVRRARVSAVPMGVNLAELSRGPTTPAIDFHTDHRIILYVGSLANERKLDGPFRGVAAVMQAQSDVMFVVISAATPAEKESALRPFVESGQDERVLFFDHMSMTELWGHIQRADVCLSPVPATPLFEVGTPTKLVEYLAVGRRVVANRHPDHVRVITGAGLGVLVDFSSQGFEAGINRSLEAGEPSASELQKARRWISDNRDYAIIARDVAETYARLLA